MAAGGVTAKHNGLRRTCRRNPGDISGRLNSAPCVRPQGLTAHGETNMVPFYGCVNAASRVAPPPSEENAKRGT